MVSNDAVGTCLMNLGVIVDRANVTTNVDSEMICGDFEIALGCHEINKRTNEKL